MADKKSNKISISSQGGMLRNFVLRIKLVLRLLGDRRVSAWLKVLPIASVAYLFSPLGIPEDFALPVIGVLDDATVLWILNYLFIELSPPNVVKEHMSELTSNLEDDSDDVVDAEATDVDKEPK